MTSGESCLPPVGLGISYGDRLGRLVSSAHLLSSSWEGSSFWVDSPSTKAFGLGSARLGLWRRMVLVATTQTLTPTYLVVTVAVVALVLRILQVAHLLVSKKEK